MQALSYSIKFENEKVLSLGLTFLLILFIYTLLVRLKPPRPNIPVVSVDQLIDTEILITKMEELKQENYKDLKVESKNKKVNLPKLNNKNGNQKIELKDIIKNNPQIIKPSTINPSKLFENKIKLPESMKSPLSSSNENNQSEKALFNSLNLMRNKNSKNSTPSSSAGTNGKMNNKLKLENPLDGSKENSKANNSSKFLKDGLTDLIPEKGMIEWPELKPVQPPSTNAIPQELKEIIRWIINHQQELPGPVNRFLQKEKGDFTTKVQFQFNGKRYELFLRATTVGGREELAYAICSGSEVAFVIDQGVNQKVEKLRLGKIQRDESGNIVGFNSSSQSFTSKDSQKYTKIFWSWWENEKNKN